MAEADLKDFLTCPVCLDTLREPLTLGCHHSFCQSCLKDYWDQNNTKNCPVCRRKSSKDVISVNFALKQLSISFREKQEATSTTEKVPQSPTHAPVCRQQPEVPPVCSLHPEVPPLFCKDEGRALCPVCEFSQHQRHTVVRVEEVQEELKEQMRSELETLTNHRDRYKELKRTYEKIQEHSKKQAGQCEAQIRAVFNRLHQFLQQEETRALEALREEQRRQAQALSPELGRIREELTSVETTIQDLKDLLQKDTVLHYRPQRPLLTTPALGPGLLLDQAKVLGNLGFRVWRRMRREVTYSPVILDPNTANTYLHLTEDLSEVRQEDTYQKVPDNPERFTEYATVLGSEGFSSGTHQWDVEVGDHPDWNIGVAKESVKRKERIQVSPKHGVWSLWHREGIYINSRGETIPVKKPPEKIRVTLDCDRGEVSFYDDHMTHLYTHKDRFTDKLFPYFNVGKSGDHKTQEIKICLTEGPDLTD